MRKTLIKIAMWGGVIMTTSSNAQVFVNPTLPDQWLTQGTTTDHINLPNEESEFQIINSLGVKVAEGQLQQGGGVNVQNLPAGVYLLRTHNHTYPFTKL
ncbi:MAG: T9SS type A sorting domain-containing protein [Bacteroidetes bacterium]|nr:T9SS type A sorting domain-containing protein [Bacteroidota bacterium]